MFLSRNKKNNVYPCQSQSYYIKVGFKGSKLYRYVLVMQIVKFAMCVQKAKASVRQAGLDLRFMRVDSDRALLYPPDKQATSLKKGR